VSATLAIKRENMEHLEKLNKSLHEWAKTIKLTTHQELAKASFIAMLKTNPVVSAFSLWLLFISGAAATLFISNLATISTIIPSSSIKAVLFILILSAIAGFTVKGISLYIDMFLQINENINEAFSKIMEEHDKQEEQIEKVAGEITEAPNLEIDFNLVLKELTEPLPKWYRKKVLNAAKETEKDLLWGHKRTAKLLFGMGVAVITQVVLFVLCVLIVAICI
jgi:hypothetical protein